MALLLTCLEYIQRFLKIRAKDGSIIDFRLNPPQMRLYEVIKQQWSAGKPVRIIILKARQMGFSTLVEAIIFWMAATAFQCEAMVVAHKDEATKNLFLMSRRYLELLPEMLKPMQRASNAQELVLDRPAKYRGTRKGLGSRIRCATAGGDGVGRSYTLRALHLSEFAFWPGNKLDTLTGLLQAVPDMPGTLIVIESTANGFDEFKKQWDRAVEAQRTREDGFIPVFFAWYEMPSYRRPVPPGFQRTREEEELAQAFGLDDEQLVWRRWCISTNCGGDLDKFHQEYPATPDEAFISTGSCVFDKKRIIMRRNQVRNTPWQRGMFRVKRGVSGKILEWTWVEDSKGPIRIRLAPEKYAPYVLGGDTAGTGSDFFAAHVIDNRTGEQVAVLHHRLGERMFAEQVYCLGMYYNQALVGIEINYSTYPQLVLEDLGYKNFYVRQKLDDFTGELVNAFGFETTTRSRPLIIDGLKDVAKGALETIMDYDTLGEMLTFVYDENFKPQAEEGEHDDLVMSLAITHYIRSQQTTGELSDIQSEKKWTQDQWEDYNHASAKDREIMVKMWGPPAR